MPAARNPIVNLYLAAYNGAQTYGWATILYAMVNHYMNEGSPDTLYPLVAKPLQLWQTLAILEVVHAMLGFVRSPVGTTAMQVASRLFVAWMTLHLCQSAQSSIFLSSLLFAWSVTEVIRYAFYLLNIYDLVPMPLGWLRYSTFLILYPLGVMSELALTITALPCLTASGIMEMSLPNEWNYAFNLGGFAFVMMFAYIPGFPMLFGLMLTQRKKYMASLRGDSKKKTK
jgi:very-long-chain (3R)-3-hydroxyacyl-CoA dehydratase